MALVTVHRAPSPLPAVDEELKRGDEEPKTNFSDSFLTVKGAALFIPGGNSSVGHQFSLRCHKDAEHLRQHLQAMFNHMRPEDTLMLAAHLESVHATRVRYMTLVSTHVSHSTEESFIMGLDFPNKDSASCTIGLVLPLLSDTMIHLDGDGGFSVTTSDRTYIFKPVSVQAMWSALQCLYKACEQARQRHYHPGSRYARWLSSYASKVASEQSCLNEWNAMCDLESQRPESPALFQDTPTESARTERQIRAKLREIMAQCDLESVTSKEIRNKLELQMVCNLKEYKGFIDNEMIIILGQMDCPSHIFDHVYLGSEWNASDLEDLKKRGIGYILNVTREIDNFFPGVFEYRNVRVYDMDSVNLRAYWNDTYNFVSLAKGQGSKCLVHCKMGVSRSASTVIAYAMKEYGWTLEHAYSYVKSRRSVIQPNSGFMRQLEEYQGILDASKQRHNKLWRSHSEGDISEHATDKDMDRSFTQGAVVCDGEGEAGESAPRLEVNNHTDQQQQQEQQQQPSPCPQQPSPQLLGSEGGGGIGATLIPAPRPKSWSPDVCPPYVTPFQLIRMDSEPCAASPTELSRARFDAGALSSEPCTPTSLDMERRRAPSLSESRKSTFSFELPTIHIEDMERDALESSSDDDFHLAAEILNREPKPAPATAQEADGSSATPAEKNAGAFSPTRSPGARPPPLPALAANARPLSPQTPVLGPFSPVHAALQPQTASMAVKTHRGRIDFLAVMERVRSLSEEEELASPPLRPEVGRRASGQYAGAFRPVARRMPLKHSKEVGDDGKLPAQWSPHESPLQSLPKQTSWKPVCGQVRRQAEMMERRSGGLDGAGEEKEEEAVVPARVSSSSEVHRPPSLSEIAAHSTAFQSTVDEVDVFDVGAEAAAASTVLAQQQHRLCHQQSIAQLQQAGLVRRTAGRWSGTGTVPHHEQEEDGEEGNGQEGMPPGGEQATQEIALPTAAGWVQKLIRGESGGDDGGAEGGDSDDKASKPRMQHQTSILQLAEAGLVRKQSKELQKKMISPDSSTTPDSHDPPTRKDTGGDTSGTAEPENNQQQSLAPITEIRPEDAEQDSAHTEPGKQLANAPEKPREEPGVPPLNGGAPQKCSALPSALQPETDTRMSNLKAIVPQVHLRSANSAAVSSAAVSSADEASAAGAGNVIVGHVSSPCGPGNSDERRAIDTDIPSLDKPPSGTDDGAPPRGLPTQAAPWVQTMPHLPVLHADHGHTSLVFSETTVFSSSPSEESGIHAPTDQKASSEVRSASSTDELGVAEGACAAPKVLERPLAEGDATGEEAVPRRPHCLPVAATESCPDDDIGPTAGEPALQRRQQRSSST